MPEYQLDKSRYVDGTICRKRLWLQAHRPDLAAPSSPADERIKEEGTQVGIQARTALYPDGLLIEQFGDEAAKATREVMKGLPSAIFEATFAYHNVLVMCDILVNNFDGTWDLIEVKASTRGKPEYLHDVAVQAYVLRGAGVALRQLSLLLIDNSAPADADGRSLFVKRNVTDEVLAILDEVSPRVESFLTLLGKAEEPDVPIGNHCRNPYPCPFVDSCWQHVPEPSIFSIPRLKGSIKSALAAQDILRLEDLPEDVQLSESQRCAVRLMVEKREQIDISAIHQKLETLVYPIYFFDFETDAPAIPQHPGLKPYSPVPFQYSCHLLTENGSLTHVEYLHQDATDPRPPLLESLLSHIGPVGSVVVYNASFERGVLSHLMQMALKYTEQAEHAEAIQSIIDRLWDQLEIFKQDYKSYRFGGSNSIKKVLPVVAPQLSYGDLSVQRGDQAQAVWNQMIKLGNLGSSGQQKQQLVEDLLAYCKLDTLAMVEIHRHLEGLCQPELA